LAPRRFGPHLISTHQVNNSARLITLKPQVKAWIGKSAPVLQAATSQRVRVDADDSTEPVIAHVTPSRSGFPLSRE
jgi:hypothetical protein